MPVILSIEEAKDYIDTKDDFFLNSSYNSELEKHIDFYKISNFVNSPKNDSKKCIEYFK